MAPHEVDYDMLSIVPYNIVLASKGQEAQMRKVGYQPVKGQPTIFINSLDKAVSLLSTSKTNDKIFEVHPRVNLFQLFPPHGVYFTQEIDPQITSEKLVSKIAQSTLLIPMLSRINVSPDKTGVEQFSTEKLFDNRCF
jgi:hypothetical protein